MAPVFMNVIRHFNFAIPSITTLPSMTATPVSTSLSVDTSIPTITSIDIPPTSTPSFIASSATNAIPNWVYVVLALLFLLVAGISVFMVHRYYTTGVRRRSQRERKEGLLWKGVEEGRREKFVDALRKLDGYGVKGKKKKTKFGLGRKIKGDSDDDEPWEDIDLNECKSKYQSQDWKEHVEVVLSRIKALDSVGMFSGAVSAPELVVPGKALVKEPRVVGYTPGLDVYNIPFATPGCSRWENVKLSPVCGTIYK